MRRMGDHKHVLLAEDSTSLGGAEAAAEDLEASVGEGWLDVSPVIVVP